MSNPYEKTRDESASILGPTLKFKGTLTADEDLLIQGTIEGTVKHSSSLTIGENGHVKANVSAEYIAVEGRVEGDLAGGKCVKIRETARIDGNVVSPNVSLTEGAKFNGKIDMDSDPAGFGAGKPGKTEKVDAVATDEVKEERKTAKTKRPSSKKDDATDKTSADAA